MLTSLFPEGVRPVAHPLPESLPEPAENPGRGDPELPTLEAPRPETAPEPVTSSQGNLTVAGRSRVDEQPQDWREELSERVESFRKRRAHLQPDAEPVGNLELDFESIDKPEDHRSFDGALGTPEDQRFGVRFGNRRIPRGPRRGPTRRGETPALEESGDDMMQLDAAPVEAEEMSLGEPVGKSPPMEILVGSPTETAPEEEERAEGILLAPLGRRFLAGLTDALVLILGAAVFGIIFWRFCGRLSMVPLNIAVLGLVAVILIFAYFAVVHCRCFRHARIAVDGMRDPQFARRLSDRARILLARLRGTGVAFGAHAGFHLGRVDSDGLTWHDRMSGTVITEEHTAAESRRPESGNLADPLSRSFVEPHRMVSPWEKEDSSIRSSARTLAANSIC